MLTLSEARSRLMSKASALPSEIIPLSKAAARVLAEDLVARGPLPPFDYSAMDGYALCAADLAGDGPWELPVVGEAPAGSVAADLIRHAACRIFTGGPLPRGADLVIPQEHVERRETSIRISQRPAYGQFVRRAGEDMREGAIALAAGTRLSAGALSLAAMLDRESVVVARKPVVKILCTGNELRAPGAPGPHGTIAESNTVALAALAEQASAVVQVLPLAPDDPKALDAALSSALDADVLITVGGVSVGEHDHVRPSLERAGVEIDFWRVAIKPGKPLVVGSRGRTHVLGLPGNPASALVTHVLFGLPLLRALQGDARPLADLLPARLDATRSRSSDRLELARARLQVREGALWAVVDPNQASGAATSLASSDGVCLIPQGEASIEAGSPVDFLRWIDA
jgi:molybdopterin molybdotransferase